MDRPRSLFGGISHSPVGHGLVLSPLPHPSPPPHHPAPRSHWGHCPGSGTSPVGAQTSVRQPLTSQSPLATVSQQIQPTTCQARERRPRGRWQSCPKSPVANTGHTAPYCSVRELRASTSRWQLKLTITGQLSISQKIHSNLPHSIYPTWSRQGRAKALTGITRGLLEMRSREVTWRVWSSLHLTSRVNSTEHSGQNSSQVQS